MVAGQMIALGRIHARQVVTVHVAADAIAIDLDHQDSRTVSRTTTQPVRSIKAAQSRKGAGNDKGGLHFDTPKSNAWKRTAVVGPKDGKLRRSNFHKPV